MSPPPCSRTTLRMRIKPLAWDCSYRAKDFQQILRTSAQDQHLGRSEGVAEAADLKGMHLGVPLREMPRTWTPSLARTCAAGQREPRRVSGFRGQKMRFRRGGAGTGAWENRVPKPPDAPRMSTEVILSSAMLNGGGKEGRMRRL